MKFDEARSLKVPETLERKLDDEVMPLRKLAVRAPIGATVVEIIERESRRWRYSRALCFVFNGR